jgi:hypothetical protein
MESLLTILAVAAYVVAAYLLWADRSLRPLLLLLAGSIATLAQPLWLRLFGATIDAPGNVLRVGSAYMLPLATIFGGGALLAIPPLLIWYGLRHGWWGQHYAAAWGFFIAFVLFFLIFISFEQARNVMLFARPRLPRPGLPEALLEALLLASTSFGLLYAFVSTRHYALRIALIPLLFSGLAAALLLLGILCSPYWLARLLNQRDQVILIGAIVSVFLVLWAIHLLASGLHAGRMQRLQWR